MRAKLHGSHIFVGPTKGQTHHGRINNLIGLYTRNTLQHNFEYMETSHATSVTNTMVIGSVRAKKKIMKMYAETNNIRDIQGAHG